MTNLFFDSGPAATGRKVCLATTAYDNPDAAYTFSIQKSREALHQAGIQTAYLLLSGNCHVDDARNVVVQEFLLSDCTDLVFLDADVSWEPRSLIEICRYNRDIVGAVYPFRREGSGSNYNLPMRMAPKGYSPDGDGLIEVDGLPAGFMRIRRNVLEMLSETADHYWNRGDRRSKVPILFERSYAEDLRWGGDLNFCNKWRATGGCIYAAPEIVLGHTGKTIIRDSLAATLRRRDGETLRHLADRVAAGSEDASIYTEARKYVGNEFTALEDVLLLSAIMAREADGPIIEAGSGLTTIVMAAATEHPVYCLEHDPIWAAQLDKMIHESGVRGIGLCVCPITDGWYDLTDYPDLPEQFALGLNDGPPRIFGSRMGFYDRFGGCTDVIIADDADDRGYADAIEAWAGEHDRHVDFIDARAALIRRVDNVKINEKETEHAAV